MTKRAPSLTLRPVEDRDIPLLSAWLRKDRIRKWYHDPADWLLEINGCHGAYSWIRHFIAVDGMDSVEAEDESPKNGVTVGFCQYYDCYDARDLESWYSVTRRGDTFSIDYLIGDDAYPGKGYGKALVRILTKTIQEKEQAARIIVQPDAGNIPSYRALSANGYGFDVGGRYYRKELR